jgi:hypothetical protein
MSSESLRNSDGKDPDVDIFGGFNALVGIAIGWLLLKTLHGKGFCKGRRY